MAASSRDEQVQTLERLHRNLKEEMGELKEMSEKKTLDLDEALSDNLYRESLFLVLQALEEAGVADVAGCSHCLAC